MKLLTPELYAKLRANDIARHAAIAEDRPEPDPIPVLKLFNPAGAATWVATELYADDDTLFGVADLGFGWPELGVFSLREISEVRLPFGLRIERDLHFTSDRPLSEWADLAHRTCSLLQAEFEFRRAAVTGLPLPKRRG